MTKTKDTSTKAPRPADDKTEIEKYERERVSRLEQILHTREEAFLNEEKTLISWEADSRVFKPRSREYYTTIGAIVVLVSIILLFVREFLLMFVVIAFSFVSYVMASVKPDKTSHEVSTRGIRTGGKFYRWDELGRFWIDQTSGASVLYVETYRVFPSQLMMLIDKKDEAKFKDLLAPYVLLEKPEPGFVDNAANWLAEKVPLEGA